MTWCPASQGNGQDVEEEVHTPWQWVDSTDFKTLSIEPPTFHRQKSETEGLSPNTSLGLAISQSVGLSQTSWTGVGAGETV